MTQQVSQDFVKTIADAVPGLIAYWDRDLRCSFANKQYSQWFGRPVDQIIGQTMRHLLGEPLFSLNIQQIDAALAGDEQRFERVSTKADGSIAYAWVSYIPHRDLDAAVLGFFVLVADITPLRRADQRAKESEGRYRLLADHSSDMVFQLDADCVQRYVSPACREILGYEPHELIGVRSVEQVYFEDAERVAEAFRSLLDGSVDRTSVTNRIRHRNGHWVWVEVELRSIKDPGGSRSGIVGAMRDITIRKSMEAELAEANRQLENLARQDGLTGLANRRSFDETLSRYHDKARIAGEDFAVVMIDVDRFKLFNDCYGHQAGDQCLQQVSRTIVESIRRPFDIAARYGGEEFALLLPDTGEDGAALVAERIRRSVELLGLEHEGSPHGIVTISAGISSIASVEERESSDLLLRSADRALYVAKGAGRNGIARASEILASARLIDCPFRDKPAYKRSIPCSHEPGTAATLNETASFYPTR